MQEQILALLNSLPPVVKENLALAICIIATVIGGCIAIKFTKKKEALPTPPKDGLEGPKTEEPKAEEPKTEEPKAEEPKAEEPKAEEPKAEEPKAEEPKAEEPKAEEPKAEEPKAEEPKAEEPKAEEPKAEEPKAEEPKAEEPKAEEPKAEEPKAEETKAEEPKTEEPTAEQIDGMKRGLAKTQSGFMARLNAALFGKKGLSAELLEELESILYSADIGVRTVDHLLEALKARYAKQSGNDAEEVKESLKDEIITLLAPSLNAPKSLARPNTAPIIYMFVGVNGVGKTTTIGKIASQLINEGKSVMLAAGDTFRAAAADQLQVWAERNNCPIFRGKEGQDPASVIFGAAKQAAADHIDYLLVDTAGRLHTKTNLMEELKKVHRVLGKAREGAPDEVLLVVDATTGQNAILQAKEFSAVTPLSGIILTKLDGTSKGGVIIGINAELNIPIRYIGVGEKITDLQPFNAKAFVKTLFE